MSEINKQGGDFINIKDLWDMFLGHWHWFALSIGLCMAVAITYIVITPPTYTRKATILIKNNNNRRQGTSNMEPLAEMGLFKQTTDAQSEVYILKSPQLMESVVHRLKLENNYSIKFKSVRYVDIYNSTPVTVALDSIASRVPLFGFEIKLRSEDQVELFNFSSHNKGSDFQVKVNLGEWVETPFGSVCVTSTPNYHIFANKNILFSRKNPISLSKRYVENLSIVIPEEDVPVIDLSYNDVNAQRAEDILNTLIAIYNENWIQDKNQITASTSEFIGERLYLIEDELDDVDQDISKYKSEHLITDVHAVSMLYLDQSSSNAAKLLTLQNQLSMARYIRSYMNDATFKSQLIPANTGLDNMTIEGQIEKYNVTLLQKNSLAENSSENNPVVASMIQSLVLMREAIYRSVDDYISTLNIQLDNIRSEEKKTNQKIASSPKQAKHLLSIERQQKVKEALYLFLLQKREENELAQTFTAYNTKVVNLPSGSSAPTAPRRNIIMLAALVIGLLIPAVILLIMETLNTIVREKKDIDKLNIPFIGEIPYLPDQRQRSLLGLKKKNAKPEEKVLVVVHDKNRNIINEAFRSIRTNIDFMRPRGEQGTVLMTTSLNPGSGKTFTTINVAMAMVLKGVKVLVVDVDLRKASLSSVVDSPKEGLSNYLNGSVKNIDKLIIRGVMDSPLDVLPVGKIPPNPSELLLEDRFANLIEELRGKYDYIFLDCPPVSLVTDTAVIAHQADLTMFIIRAGLMDKRMLPEVERVYNDGHIKNMAIILNGLDYAYGGRYGYKRYGYKRYGYRYGYGYGKKGYGYGNIYGNDND